MNADVLPHPDERALIGVSGGRDSVALLHALLARGYSNLVVCHLDHALRAVSGDDATFVRELCGAWKVPCVIHRAPVEPVARIRKLSLETAARGVRHRFFARVSRRLGCRNLLLAHHADDQVETLLMNLCRGAGLAGLGAMAGVSEMPIGRIRLKVLRPLLTSWRAEIDAYIEENRLPYREDASNADPHYTRNRVRNELVPLLSDVFGRDVRHVLLRATRIMRDADNAMAALTPEPAAELILSEIRSLPDGLRSRLILEWLRLHGVPSVGSREVEAVERLIAMTAAKVNLPGGIHARRRAGRLFLEFPSRQMPFG